MARFINFRRFLMCLAAYSVASNLLADFQNQFTHPIQRLLLDYSTSFPPENDMLILAKKHGLADSITAVKLLLGSVDTQEVWPSAVKALGLIGDPHDVILKENLTHFGLTLLPFGCAPRSTATDCKPREASPITQHWDREARLQVPGALGYLLRTLNRESRPGRKDALVTSSLLDQLSNMATTSYVRDQIEVCKKVLRDNNACSVEMQVNAVRALQASGHSEAKGRLQMISTDKNENPLVVQEANNALQQLSAPR